MVKEDFVPYSVAKGNAMAGRLGCDPAVWLPHGANMLLLCRRSWKDHAHTPVPCAGLVCLPGLFAVLSGAGCVVEVPAVMAAGLRSPEPVLDSVMTTGGVAGRGMAEKDTWPASRWP